jgi:hypothetical protein
MQDLHGSDCAIKALVQNMIIGSNDQVKTGIFKSLRCSIGTVESGYPLYPAAAPAMGASKLVEL